MFTEKIAPQSQQASFRGSRFIINHEFQFIYCPIPKNASSSLKALCLQLANVPDCDNILESRRVHPYANNLLTLSTYPRAEAHAFLDDPRYFKFCIVRNPWSRLASAYLNKFLQQPPLPMTTKVIRTVYLGKGLEPDLAQSITFRQFVEYVADTKHQGLDVHWTPQHRFLGDLQFHFIARFETLAEDFQVIKQVAKLPLDLPWRNQSSYNDTVDPAQPWADLYPAELRAYAQLPPYQQFYTPDLVEKVRQGYQIDIELFGYEFAG